MSLKQYFAPIIESNNQTRLRAFLRPLSWLFGKAVGFRDYGYTQGWFRQEKLPVKVISIGGITVGGAGKTPVVRHLARALADAGERVAILSRGYGRKSKGAVVISDGTDLLLDWEAAGDEPYFLASALPDVAVIVGSNRVEAGHLALQTCQSTVLLLDDGFQHRRLARDIDIVVLDSTYPDGNSQMLPTGPLREPLEAIQRAHAIILTRVDQCKDISSVRRRIAQMYPDAPTIETSYRPVGLRRLSDDTKMSLDQLQDRPVVTLSGIANPQSFERTVEQSGARIIHTMRYIDHHPFIPSEIYTANQIATENQADWIITSEKDAVRIPKASDRSRLILLEIELQITQGEKHIKNIILDV